MMYKPLAILIILLISSCAGTPDAPAPWDTSPDAIQNVYPDNEFIARRGLGKTREEAEADGAAQIARFFNTQIKSSLQITEQNLEQNGNIKSKTEIETETFIQSQMNISGIRYARDAYFDKRLKAWITVAYINRMEAWNIYEPRLRSASASFITAYDAAETSADPLSQYSRFYAVMRLGNENGGVGDMLSYAQILYPEKAREYISVQNALSSIPVKRQAVLDKVIISINCNNDFENIISGAIIDALRQGGFKTGNAGSTNMMEVAIDDDRQIMDAGTFFSPRLTLTVYGGNKTLFTWTVNAERQGAWDAAVARRQAWNALALIIKESLLNELKTAIEGGNL